MDIGYIRVSSLEQNTHRQLEGVRLDRVYVDTVSGKNMQRPQLQKCLSELQRGDMLHVHSIDRLSRNLNDMLILLTFLQEIEVSVYFHKERLIFSKQFTPFETLHLHIMAAVAQFERTMIRERQREGIAIAKALGKYKGRKPRLSAEQVREVVQRSAAEPVRHLAKAYGMSRQSIYRILSTAKRGGMKAE